MEIDFLGLNSNKCTTHQDSSKDSFSNTWKGGVETSLSLSPSCLFDSQTNEKKKQQQQQQQQNWELPGDTFSHYSQGSSSSRAGQHGLVLVSMPAFVQPPPSPFLYSLNDNPCSRKNMPELSSEPGGLRMFYPGRAAGDKGTYASPAIGAPGDARTGTRGYTPTVAMARRATLARFLEKRIHRMNQARTAHLMGNPEVCNSSSTITSRSSNDKKRHNSIIKL